MQAGTENGSRLQLWEDVNGDSQLWQTEETDAGCKLKSCKSGRCMDAGMEAAAGAPIQLWDDVNGENQLWDLVPVSVRKPAAPKADKPEAPQNSEPAAAPKSEKAPAKKAAGKTGTRRSRKTK